MTHDTQELTGVAVRTDGTETGQIRDARQIGGFEIRISYYFKVQ
jgi:hypothetical protein